MSKENRIEQILISLHEVAGTDTRYAAKAKSLLGWYNSEGDLSEKQQKLATAVILQCAGLRKMRMVKDYFLYAIDDGVNIKIGHSTNPNARMRGMQTGQASTLKLVWSAYVGNVQAEAIKLERKLHRYCRRYAKRGEWFHRDCMVLVRQFEIRRKVDLEHKEEMIELEILNEARNRI